MDIKKGLLAGLMVTTISMTALTSVYAKGPVENKGKSNIAICTSNATECTIDSNFDFNFKEFSKEFKENVSQEDYKKAENLFNKAIKLEDDASEYWDELYKLDLFDTSVMLGNIEPMPFEEFSKMFKKDVTAETKNKAKEIYNKIIKLEKEGKFDETIELWKQLDSLDMYDKMEGFGVVEVSMNEIMSFEDFAKNFKKDVKEEDKKKAKELYEKAAKLEKDDKFDEATKVWDQLFEMNLFDEMGDIEYIEVGDNVTGSGASVVEFNGDVDKISNAGVVMLDGDIDIDKIGNADVIKIDDDMIMGSEVIIDSAQPFTFEEFSKGFKKDLKPEIIKKAKDLFEKATNKEEEAQKVWDEIYKMDIFEVYAEEVSTEKEI